MRIGFATLLLVFLAACGAESVKQTPLIVEWRGATSAVAAPQTRIVQTDSEWQELWGLVGQPAPQALKPGSVGVAVFLGEKPTAGYGVDMGWTETDSGLDVKWQEIEPAPSSVTGAMVTQPWRIAMLKADGKQVMLAEGQVREIENENTVVENEIQDEVEAEGPAAAAGTPAMVEDTPAPANPPPVVEDIVQDIQEDEELDEDQDPAEVFSDQMPTQDEGADSE